MKPKDEDKPQVAMAQAIRTITENWAGHIEFHRTMARVARVKFLALVAEGFTEEQALQLVRW
ncbi:hypothetical protein [Pseudoduganella violacea]|uniref:Uncharacterized protein n=1 Tax=Pseudoduganella violacea TaxID=1715466 RepID=A0A7W5FTH7_9BURK|nr:hypothetical protein [Pseudoduganella violacea]MBB3118880.1 hypothetical protein [Pseudoduganella violacea]